jgi:tape measure domain-containing protein
MSVVANLAINVDSSKALSQLKLVDNAAGSLAKNAAAIPTKISGGLDGLGTKLQGLGSRFSSLGGAIASLGAGVALKGFLDAGVAAERTSKTITALAGSYDEVAGVNKIANETAKEFGIGQTTAAKGIADLYGRLRPMGVSLKDIGKTFTGVNKAASLMNLTSADTDGVMLQLSQAMGSGVLQGDELRSVMERLPAVGQAVAKVMGVTVGQIKELGSKGKITTAIMVKAMDELGKLKPPPPDATRLYTAALEDLQTTIGKKLMPMFTPFLRGMASLITAFSALPQPVQNLVIGIGGLLGVLTLIAAPLGFLVAGIGNLMVALAAANIGGLIAGWAAVAAPAILAINGLFAGLVTFLTGTIFPALVAIFSGPAGWTVLAVAAVVAMVVLFRKPIADFLVWLGNSIGTAFNALMGMLYPVFVQPFIDLWNNVLRQPVTSMFNWISGFMGNSMRIAFRLIYQIFVEPFVVLWERVLRKPVTAFINWVKRTLGVIAGFFADRVVGPIYRAWEVLTGFLSSAITLAADTARSVWDAFAGWFNSTVVQPIARYWNGLIDGIVSRVQSVRNAVVSIWSNIVSTITGGIVAGVRGVIGATGRIINSIIGGLNQLIAGINKTRNAVGLSSFDSVPIVSMPTFAKGGVVSGPTVALVGEGGEPEYIIPESKMAAASANYLSGARGGSVIPAMAEGGYAQPRGAAQGRQMPAAVPVINITTGPVIRQDDRDYVSVEDMQKALRQTVQIMMRSLQTPDTQYGLGLSR